MRGRLVTAQSGSRYGVSDHFDDALTRHKLTCSAEKLVEAIDRGEHYWWQVEPDFLEHPDRSRLSFRVAGDWGDLEVICSAAAAGYSLAFVTVKPVKKRSGAV